MNEQNPLIVPMTVEALVVNDIFRTNGNSFVRNQMQYSAMQQSGNGQPGINNNDTNFTLHATAPVPPNNVPAGDFYNGVYLKWRLPEAFTSGVQDSASGITTYPYVPNRWLIVRYSGPLTARLATAWIVESDYLYPGNKNPSPINASQVACFYVQPDASGLTPVAIPMGRNELLGSWAESGNDLELTAMAPGNPSFAVFQPQCNNVFSFIDCLNTSPAETLSYMVCGWFSDQSHDPLFEKNAVFSKYTSNGATNTLTFTAASASQANWAAGTITVGTNVYNISAGNTGDMSQQTYIYFNPAVSATALQITTSLETAQATGCILLATSTPYFIAQLAALGWTLPTSTDPTLVATWSLLYGSVGGVQWQNNMLPPGGAPQATGGNVPVTVAVGNSSVEALTAMITAQAAIAGDVVDSELLEAFQLDLTEVFDMPDGAAILAEKLQESFFQKFSGGYSWNIVDAPDSTTPVSAQDLVWLATLNLNQQQLDEAILELASLQSQLYTMWWKYTDWPWAYQGNTSIAGLNDQTELKQQLDPKVSGSLAQKTANQITTVNTLMAQVPTGASPDELNQAILAYATQHKLPPTKVLKRASKSPFYLPNNPVVMIAGAGASGIVQTADTILCRFPSQVVTGFKFGNQTITALTNNLAIPLPDLANVTGAPWSSAFLNSLVQEFFFLDQNNATMVATAISASVSDVQDAMSNSANDLPVYPTGAIGQWTANPWHPLLLYWQVAYYPIEYGTDGAPNWIFEDGKYIWNGLQSGVGSKTNFQGTVQLTPVANFNMQSRIKAFLKNTPGLDPLEKEQFEKLLDFVDNTDNWDLLSQALDGFNNQMQLGMPGVYISPASTQLNTSPPLPQLIGSATGYPPGLDNIPSNTPYPASNFLPWRSGQFEFIQLVVIDEWGQALWPIDSLNYSKTTVYMPADLTPVVNSAPFSFTIANTATIDSIQPNMASAGNTGITLTVNGVNFTSQDTIEWQGTILSTTFVSPTQLTAPVSDSLLASAGTANVTVNSAGVISNTIPFTIASGPAIASLTPDLIQAGMATSDTFNVIVQGIGFTPASMIQWNGTAVDTEFTDSGTLIATIPSNFTFTPGIATVTVVSGSVTSNSVSVTLSSGSAIASLTPNIAASGQGGFTISINGVGFELSTIVVWNNTPLTTTFVNSTQLTAVVTASELGSAGTVIVTASIGAKVLPNAPDSLIQLPPALLQPAQLDFNLISSTNDSIIFGPSNPDADPICGWVLPNHLDQSLMAYENSGTALGEMAIDMSSGDAAIISWIAAPGSPYATLAEIAANIPHFGNFLQSLSQQTTTTFTAFLQAIDETLWTTAPMGATFDQNLALLIGRPLAMVRANLQFLLDGSAVADPSWQYTFSPSPAEITQYKFAIELGNVAQLKDGLIGYFVEDQYSTFNIVTEAGATAGSYLAPIGVNNNYIYLPFDGTTSAFVSMLVDPYAAVHATTAILPVASVGLPPQFAADALSAMNVTFRIDGILTDQQIPATGNPIILMPVPKETSGQWQWIEDDGGTWTSYNIAPNNATARLSDVPPVLRRGILQLSSSISTSAAGIRKGEHNG